MKKKIFLAIILIIVMVLVALVVHEKSHSEIITGVEPDNNSTVVNIIEKEAKKDDVVTIRVSMSDSGSFKAMALSLEFDKDTFELVDGEWINHKAVLADFNKENLDAAIAFAEAETFCGEIFEFSLKLKKDVKFTLDDIHVNPVLKNGIEDIVCKGIILNIV